MWFFLSQGSSFNVFNVNILSDFNFNKEKFIECLHKFPSSMKGPFYLHHFSMNKRPFFYKFIARQVFFYSLFLTMQQLHYEYKIFNFHGIVSSVVIIPMLSTWNFKTVYNRFKQWNPERFNRNCYFLDSKEKKSNNVKGYDSFATERLTRSLENANTPQYYGVSFYS